MKKKGLLGILGIFALGLLASCGDATTSTTMNTGDASTSTTIATTKTTEALDPEIDGIVYKVSDTLEVQTLVQNGFTFDQAKGLLTFNTSGEYIIRGVLNGSIECSATLVEKVTLVLNGVTITSDKPAISWLSESSKIEVKAKKDTENYLITTDSTTLTNSTIESNNNVEFGGKGSLSIINNQKHAVSASEIVVKNEISLNITSNVKDGLHAKAITIENGNIDITAVMDAMEAEVNSKGNKGTILITGGTIKIHDSKVAIKAATSISFENPVDTDAIGILLKVNNISDKVLQSESITNKSTALTYYLNDTLTEI